MENKGIPPNMNVYDIALYANGKDISKEELIRNAIAYVLTEGKPEEIKDILGENAYQDFQIHSGHIQQWKPEYFLDVFDTIQPGMENKSKEKKLRYLEELFTNKSYAISSVNFAIAEKLRRDHFPNEGLESTLIANGMGKFGSNRLNNFPGN